ncbi:MAG: hypothetical protein QF637_01280, partial [Acidimicrobiales bacterium]|nr:hypothetical protein [Acidimicrobiales bacterium]
MSFNNAALGDETPIVEDPTPVDASMDPPLAPPAESPPREQGWDSIVRIVAEVHATHPAGEVDPNGIGRVMDLAHLSGVDLSQRLSQSNNAIERFRVYGSNMEAVYRTEVYQAQAESRQCYEEAVRSHDNAEKYAHMTAVIGIAATQEIQERDFRCIEMAHHALQFEHIACTWEHNARVIYEEANARIQDDVAGLSSAENRMQTFRSELDTAQRMVTQESDSYAAFLQLQLELPAAQQQYRSLCEALAREQGTSADLRASLARSDAQLKGISDEQARNGPLISRLPVVEREIARLNQMCSDEEAENRVLRQTSEAHSKLSEKREEEVLVLDRDLKGAETELDVMVQRNAGLSKQFELLTGVPPVWNHHGVELINSVTDADPKLKKQGDRDAEIARQLKTQNMRMCQLTDMVAQVQQDWGQPATQPETGYLGEIQEVEPKPETNPQVLSVGEAANAELTRLLPKTPVGPTPPMMLTTQLTQRAKAGDLTLQVVSTRGMKVGQKIRIGRDVFEEINIKAFGSIHLTRALLLDHPAGAPVVVVESATNVPRIDIVGEESEEGEETVDADSGKSTPTTHKMSTKAPNLPSRPTSQHEMRTFHMNVVEAVLQVSQRTDMLEKKFLDEMLPWKVDDPRLDLIPKRMVNMNRNLKPGLLKLCKGDSRLHDEIERQRTMYGMTMQLITARKVLSLLYHSLATDKSLLEVCTIKHLAAIKWESYGDKDAYKFLSDFQTIVARMTNPLDIDHQRILLYTEMSKSEGLKLPMIKYDDAKEEDQTYDMLIEIYRKWLAKTRSLENNTKEMALSTHGGRGRQL